MSSMVPVGSGPSGLELRPDVGYVRVKDVDLQEWFAKYSEAGLMDLDALRKAYQNSGLCLTRRCLRLMMSMADNERNGSLDYYEFSDLYSFVTSVRETFLSADGGYSKHLHSRDIEVALKANNYEIDGQTLDMLVQSCNLYKGLYLTLAEYIEFAVFIVCAAKTFEKLDKDGSGSVDLDMSTLVTLAAKFR